MSSRLASLYKATIDYAKHTASSTGLEIGLPEQEFKRFLGETISLAPIYFDGQLTGTESEIKFNTPGGPLRVYQK